MHGIILAELEAFTKHVAGPAAWSAVCGQAGLAGRVYAPFGSYPDEEVVRLVSAASQLTGMPSRQLLIAFGDFIAPHLVSMYHHRIPQSWSALDLLEHTEETIHEVLRSKDPHASPPRLGVTRTSPHSLTIRYSSPRRLCDVAKGIVQGLATHYREPLQLSEPECMHDGAEVCIIEVVSDGSRLGS